MNSRHTTKEELKLDFTLAPVEFDDVILALMNGAKKYEAHGWETGKEFSRAANIASIKRHIREYLIGQMRDKESGLHPFLHVACRALMQYTLDKRDEFKLDKSKNIIEPLPNLQELKERHEKLTIKDLLDSPDVNKYNQHSLLEGYMWNGFTWIRTD